MQFYERSGRIIREVEAESGEKVELSRTVYTSINLAKKASRALQAGGSEVRKVNLLYALPLK